MFGEEESMYWIEYKFFFDLVYITDPILFGIKVDWFCFGPIVGLLLKKGTFFTPYLLTPNTCWMNFKDSSVFLFEQAIMRLSFSGFGIG